jgi:5-formyltetrahydrofolate cyclo-ligase
VHVRPVREALPTEADPTCCSGSRATIRDRHRRVAPSYIETARDPRIVAPTHNERQALRRTLRTRRRGISQRERRAAARQIALIIGRTGWLRPGARVGLYLPLREELDTFPLLHLALRRGCAVAVPRITSVRKSHMRFFDVRGAWRRGPFGNLEPPARHSRSARAMDIVFVPLVGFDDAGHRIGMGKGFYDRHFAFRKLRRVWQRPVLVGVAYDAQRVDALVVEAHDVPLDAVVTESTLRWVGRRVKR